MNRQTIMQKTKGVLLFGALLLSIGSLKADPILPSCINLYNCSIVWRLDLSAGVGYGLFRDMGASPTTFRGLVASPQFTIERTMLAPIRENRMWITLDGNLGAYAKPQSSILDMQVDAVAGMGILELGYDQKLAKRNFFMHKRVKDDVEKGEFLINPFWGISLNNYMFLSAIPNLQNSSTALSLLSSPTLRCGISFENFIFEESVDTKLVTGHRNFSMRASIGVAPIGFMLRPGFSYLDNFNASNGNIILQNFGTSYQMNTVAFPWINTELGFNYYLESGVAIGFSYQWHFLTSRNSGAYRFEECAHMFKIHLNVCLKSKGKNNYIKRQRNNETSTHNYSYCAGLLPFV